MLKSFRAALALSVITLSAFATSSAFAAPLKVVASFTVIADFAKNVGGDRVNITTIVGPDGDAHVYEPTPADAVAMAGADVVLVNGLHFEGFLQRLVDTSATKATIVTLTKGVTPIAFKPEFADADAAEGAGTGGGKTVNDPHAFQSIANAKIYVKNIADAFCAADSAGCDSYKANAAAYTQKLDALEGEVTAAIQAIPEAKRVVITSHDAFGYFEHAYGLTFLAPQGISTDSEPSAADVAKLVNQVKQDKAAAIFIENITNPRLIEQIASETGIKVGGTLYSDALSPPDGPASTYIDMMHNNIEQFKGALLGS
ncbi:metal ABC transporter substrate-binding protein [Mesorhizobium sp. M1A.F.Ca.IN.022.07.1.1]|uniref:zinc ABC transporter substrate-binding protein AztC n=1 Tax=unclassified Mesorhizobium TaxID=325217 RepID=UPI000F74D00A|nr:MULTISPECIES: zinc ABC transporter substrate-binding protein AztC [unclassified Mesorhizobium]TGV92401.1 metal ABC transporter substrate-binding protein [Mesorhizobium sp. M00.F.Ca.ET.158.01.1.1]WIE89886.1 zinc ABC transporter substrate-binding protein AztC [Mesorhizobium sp. WSM4875]AZO58177.1 metal ABC transporter substrate-binding protein [Mesorhizobium sp. M1A.F.Ca.IN.022.06.1.1]MCT2580845.1 zinc ABC transporter substrate-binding protein AztC [Mesorhizobium sp. P13.3]MDF3169851.1 zinc A